jgi:hypothetical protein
VPTATCWGLPDDDPPGLVVERVERLGKRLMERINDDAGAASLSATV